MIPLFDALLEISNFLSSYKIQYVVIGGIALQYWGAPRATQDIDITISISQEKSDEILSLVISNFQSRIDNPIDFIHKTRMVLIKASNGCDIDISLAIPGYEDEVMKRAVDYEIYPKIHIQLCSAEDLIIHKVVAARPQDVYDVESIVYKQGKRLDVKYIRFWLKEFALALEKPEITNLFEIPWNKI